MGERGLERSVRETGQKKGEGMCKREGGMGKRLWEREGEGGAIKTEQEEREEGDCIELQGLNKTMNVHLKRELAGRIAWMMQGCRNEDFARYDCKTGRVCMNSFLMILAKFWFGVGSCERERGMERRGV